MVQAQGAYKDQGFTVILEQVVREYNDVQDFKAMALGVRKAMLRVAGGCVV